MTTFRRQTLSRHTSPFHSPLTYSITTRFITHHTLQLDWPSQSPPIFLLPSLPTVGLAFEWVTRETGVCFHPIPTFCDVATQPYAHGRGSDKLTPVALVTICPTTSLSSFFIYLRTCIFSLKATLCIAHHLMFLTSIHCNTPSYVSYHLPSHIATICIVHIQVLFSVNHAIEQSKRSEADPSSSVLGQGNGSGSVNGSGSSRGSGVGSSSNASKGVTKKQGNVSLFDVMLDVFFF